MMCILFCRLVMVGLFLGTTVVSATAQNGGQIELKKKFFQSLKYTYDGGPQKSVYTFSGLGFQPHFKNLLSQYPDALEEAEKSHTYNGVTLAGSIIMLIGSFQMLANTLEEAEDVSNNRLPDNSYDAKPLGLIIIGAIIMVVGGSLSGKHLKNGIRIFNNKQNPNESEKSDIKYQFYYSSSSHKL